MPTFAEAVARYAAAKQMRLWDEDAHPRKDKGSAGGGQFRKKEDDGGGPHGYGDPADMKVKGKIEAERPCDHCGTTVLKTAVVIETGSGQMIEVGRDCAGKLLYGKKTEANARKVDKQVDAVTGENEAIDRNKRARIADDKQGANRQYASTRRSLEGSYFAQKGDEIVRVDGNDPADAKWYADHGFEKLDAITAPITAQLERIAKASRSGIPAGLAEQIESNIAVAKDVGGKYFDVRQNAIEDSKHKPNDSNFIDADQFFDSSWLLAGMPQAGEGYDLAALLERAKSQATKQPKPAGEGKVQMQQAPKGGARSDVDGRWYKGGQWMPVHGMASGRDKPKPKPAKFEGTAPVANEDGKKKRPTARQLSAADKVRIRAEKQEQRHWEQILASPFGSIFHMGDRPHGFKRRHGIMDRWIEAAEDKGDAWMKQVADKSKSIVLEQWRKQGAASDPRSRPMTAAQVKEIAEWEEQQAAEDTWWLKRAQKKAATKHPNVLRARHWISQIQGDFASHLRKLL